MERARSRSVWPPAPPACTLSPRQAGHGEKTTVASGSQRILHRLGLCAQGHLVFTAPATISSASTSATRPPKRAKHSQRRRMGGVCSSAGLLPSPPGEMTGFRRRKRSNPAARLRRKQRERSGGDLTRLQRPGGCFYQSNPGLRRGWKTTSTFRTTSAAEAAVAIAKLIMAPRVRSLQRRGQWRPSHYI